MNPVKYEMTTFTRDNKVFSHGFYKTRQSMGRAKERLNLKYGAHLKAVVIEHYQDGSTKPGFCLA